MKFERKTKLELSENATLEIKGNFYCSNCFTLKDFSSDPCDNCFKLSSGYFVGFELGRNPIFEGG